MKNRSVPADIVLPHVTYQNLDQAIGWLNRVFGFEEHYRYGSPLSGAQLRLGEAWIMVNAAKPGFSSPARAGCATQSLTIFVQDVDGHHARAKAAGAKILEDPHETVYGEYQCAAEDLEGHHWLFSRHARDANPADWGATVKNPL
ncbi:MAG TPA: VOC family protein [Candidatus Aquilonibacter sp.]|nr:VOC family protein [Candidatus Aquilonibacter sp.]